MVIKKSKKIFRHKKKINKKEKSGLSSSLSFKENDVDDNNNKIIINDSNEILLKKNNDRFIMFPIKYNDIWEMYIKSSSLFWRSNEIDLVDDVKDWEGLNSKGIILTDGDKHLIKQVLSFFAISDGIVDENLVSNFYSEVQIPEARAFYSIQIAIESIHSEVYSMLIDTIIKDQYEKNKLLTYASSHESIKNKANWILSYMEKNKNSFAKRLIAFSIVEGLFFSSSFCFFFFFKKKGILPGLTFSNELISRDEGLHCDFACLLYKNYVINKLSMHEVKNMIKEAVELEKNFAKECLKNEVFGMSYLKMADYIEYIADGLYSRLGFFDNEKIYKKNNPFDFMNRISINGKTNFFERRVGEYSKLKTNFSAEDHGKNNDEEDF